MIHNLIFLILGYPSMNYQISLLEFYLTVLNIDILQSTSLQLHYHKVIRRLVTLKYLLQKKLMSFFFLSLLLSIKCLHPCPVFLNLNSREPTPSTSNSRVRAHLQWEQETTAESLCALLAGRKLLSHSDPFRMVLINNNITPIALRFSWLRAGK